MQLCTYIKRSLSGHINKHVPCINSVISKKITLLNTNCNYDI